MKSSAALLLTATLLISSPALGQTNGFLEKLGIKSSSGTLSEGTIQDGLRDALKVGIERTVASTGKDDGYFKNDKIKIHPPKSVNRFDKAIRTAGYGPQLDEFTLSM